jgi:hypothetical protein
MCRSATPIAIDSETSERRPLISYVSGFLQQLTLRRRQRVFPRLNVPGRNINADTPRTVLVLSQHHNVLLTCDWDNYDVVGTISRIEVFNRAAIRQLNSFSPEA